MKNVLVLYYSQTGQLKSVIDSFVKNLQCDEINVDKRAIVPKESFGYPWEFYKFADEFPEAVDMDGVDVDELDDIKDDYDLIILGYTIWFLAPATPIVGFMKSAQAKAIFKDKPVVTVIACRDMWVMAHEKMKILLNDVDARLIDNVAFTDQGKGVYSFITTPRWLLTGKKDAFLFFPPAGILERDIDMAPRFGKRLKEELKKNKEKGSEPLLTNLNAVNVDGKLIATEMIATRSSGVWAKIIKAFGPKKSFTRKIGTTIYSAFLVILIFTIVPINILVRKFLNIFNKEKLTALEKKYELPSGR